MNFTGLSLNGSFIDHTNHTIRLDVPLETLNQTGWSNMGPNWVTLDCWDQPRDAGMIIHFTLVTIDYDPVRMTTTFVGRITSIVATRVVMYGGFALARGDRYVPPPQFTSNFMYGAEMVSVEYPAFVPVTVKVFPPPIHNDPVVRRKRLLDV